MVHLRVVELVEAVVVEDKEPPAEPVEFGEALVPSPLHAGEKVVLVVSVTSDFQDIAMERFRILDVGGIRGRVEALVQFAKQVLLLAVDLPERPPVLGLLFKVDEGGLSPGHLGCCGCLGRVVVSGGEMEVA